MTGPDIRSAGSSSKLHFYSKFIVIFQQLFIKIRPRRCSAQCKVWEKGKRRRLINQHNRVPCIDDVWCTSCIYLLYLRGITKQCSSIVSVRYCKYMLNYMLLTWTICYKYGIYSQKICLWHTDEIYWHNLKYNVENYNVLKITIMKK